MSLSFKKVFNRSAKSTHPKIGEKELKKLREKNR
jgi:hypothetical protein